MFYKTAMISSLLFLTACSSYTEMSDYENDVIINKQEEQGYTKVTGKDIAPVDLIEPNLALKVSVLSVTANVKNGSSSGDSEVNFEIEYPQKKASEQQTKQFDTVIVDEKTINLNTGEVSQDCNNQTCVISQNISFSVPTKLLQDSTEHGVKFLLKQKGNDNRELETMIPGRYLTALFAK